MFFVRSNYSNAAYFIYASNPELLQMAGNPREIGLFIAQRMVVFIPLTVAILLLRLFRLTIFRRETWVLLILIIAIPAFQFIMLFQGASYGWLRFFVYPLPIAMAWLPYELGKMKYNRTILKVGAMILCSIALIGSGVLTGLAMLDPELAPEEYGTYIQPDTAMEEQRAVARFINENLHDSVLLLDSFQAENVILNLNSTKYIITSTSHNFIDAVKVPHDYQVEYILAVNPEGLGEVNLINANHPELYDEGADWVTVVEVFEGYKLYKVN